MPTTLLGTGFPWGPGVKSLIEIKTDQQVLETSIMMIIMTRKGERVMLNEFGTNLLDQIFNANDPATRAIIEQAVNQEVERWDPRVQVIALRIDQENNSLICKAVYKRRDTKVSQVEQTIAFTLMNL